ncbi:CcmD family protein [Hymenobacter rigui]|uniref:CcmD family protein n=1 Tax=Hymenobacter rigui TaxID=334424 RepID=A0A3R9P9P6_9BACT|nr:CcmD family protein [Hymenobacter rigui]RSK47274.1 CcmD family protein [Hymenobacter rigui]
MKNSLRKLRPVAALLLAFLLPVLHAAAQPANQPEMADTLRQSGKIYVVVAVITVVLAGLLFFLISLDRRLTRLEKEIQE